MTTKKLWLQTLGWPYVSVTRDGTQAIEEATRLRVNQLRGKIKYMKRGLRGLCSVVMAVLVVGCWLLCASEAEAHEGPDSQSCVTCCVNHRVLPLTAAVIIPLSESLANCGLSFVQELHTQAVIRLLESWNLGTHP